LFTARLCRVTFPGRSIIALDYCGGECGEQACPAVVIGCDCGTTTHLTVEVPVSGKHQAAFTCDGCLSVNWFTVSREAG
jgi:hypothetical protein